MKGFKKESIANLFIYLFIVSSLFPHILNSESRTLTSEFRLETPEVNAFDQSLLNLNNTGDPQKLNQRVEAKFDYQVTPGDIYRLVIEPVNNNMNLPSQFLLTLSNNYNLEVPFLGTRNIKDQFFQDVRTEILDGIKKQVLTRYISFNIFQLSNFDVFIYGGVVNPGLYTANPLTRISDIINKAGGSQPGSSLRRVELIRKEKTQYLDLSRFSTLGDLSSNPILKANDKIKVMRAQRLISIRGEINYPGQYDLLNDENLKELLLFAGNFTTDADVKNIFITRKESNTPYVLNPDTDQYGEFILQNGDLVTIKTKLKPEKMVTVEGALFGEILSGSEVKTIPQNNLSFKVPYIPGMTALNLLDDFGGPTPLAQAKDSMIIRSSTKERILIDASKLWETRDEKYNLSIEPGDLFYIPSKDKTVLVKGEVVSPKLIQYENGRSIDFYLKAAGGLTENGTNQFSIIDSNNSTSRGNLSTIPQAGSTIIAEKNFWAATTTLFSDFSSIASVITALIATYNLIIGLF